MRKKLLQVFLGVVIAIGSLWGASGNAMKVAKVDGWLNPTPIPKGSGVMTYADWNVPYYFTWAGPEKAVKFRIADYLGAPPITIDTIMMLFYEHSSYPWPDSTIHIVIYGSDGQSVIYTSDDFIAHRYPDVTYFVPPSPITVNDWFFYVSIVTADTNGFPSILSDTLSQGHSFYGSPGDWNNYTSGEFFVAVHASWADLEHDIELTDIVRPAGVELLGDTIIPAIEVLNNGPNDETFDAVFNIYHEGNLVYSSTVTNSIDSVAIDTVVFDEWVISDTGHYTIETYVTLSGDQNPSNDTLTKDVLVISEVPVITDFETDNGGLVPDPASGGWEWGTPTAGPDSAHSGINVWGTALGDNYPNNADFYLVSGNFIVTQGTQVVSFWQWRDIESHWDGGNVAISTDGGNTWQVVNPVGGYPDDNVYALGEPGFTGSSNGWEQVFFVLNLPVGTVFRIRWHFASDGSVNGAGWYIDDLMGYGFEAVTYEHDVGVTELSYQPETVTSSDTFSVNVKVKNFGVNSETFNVITEIYDANQTAVYASSQQVTLGAGDTTTVAFDNINLAAGVYTIFSRTVLSGDQNPDNDTMSAAITVFQYAENFEASDGGYAPDPATGGWEWGTPVVGPSGAHSGTNLWGTVLANNYPNNADLFLESPDMIATDSVQQLTFWQWYQIEGGWDGGNVAISTDGGATWQVISPEGGYPRYVYSLSDSGFSGYATTWSQVRFNMHLPAGTIFKIRWHFASDGSVNYPGWYIDDVMGVGFERFYLEHDVAPVAITPDSGIWPTVPFGVNVDVANNGIYSESFDVTFRIYDASQNLLYENTQSVTALDSGTTTTLRFDGCVVPDYGVYQLVAITELNGDQIPLNDTMRLPLGVYPSVSSSHVGGPDTYGYYFIDSDAPGGPQFNWIEAIDSVYLSARKDVAKKVKDGDAKGWDDGYFIVPLPFSFNFYGNDYDTVYASTNGLLTFGSPNTSYSNKPIPYSYTPNNFIAPFWDDLKFYENDSARLDTVSGVTSEGVRYFVIEYENVVHLGHQGEVTDFEVILYENGDILIQYDTLSEGTYTHGESATVGIEGPDGETGLQYIYNGEPFTLHEGLAVLFSTRINPYYHDVALDAIVTPADSAHLIALQTIQPVVRVKNTGFYPEADTFEVGIEIHHAKGVNVHYSKTVYLYPGDSMDVTFPDYTIPEGGEYYVTAYVSLPGDADPGNDTLVTVFYAETVDANVVAILAPVDTVLYGTSVSPVVKVTNDGTIQSVVPVTLSIPSVGYEEQYQADIPAGDTVQLVFPEVVLDQAGVQSVIAYTSAEYDIDVTNDTLESEVFVAYPDAGVDSIINPVPVTYSEGDTFTPIVRVANFGNIEVTTPVVVEIWKSYAKSRELVYADTAQVTVAANDYVEATMNELFTLQDSGYYEVDAYTLLENDMQNENDTAKVFFSSFLYRDVGVEEIVTPGATYNIHESVIPEAVFRNYGTAEATFTAELKIFYEGNFVTVDSIPDVTIPAGGATNLQFNEFTFEHSGNYTFKFCVKYGEDMDTTNNILTTDVFVQAHDIALTGVVEPSGNLYEVGTWIFPAVEVANNGNVAENFDVVLEVTKNGAFYLKHTAHVSLDAGAADVAVFDSVLLDEEGTYSFTYSVNVAHDTCSSDNTVSAELNASYHDVGIVDVIDLDMPLYHVGDNIPLSIVVSNNKLFDEPAVECVVNVTADDSLVFTRTVYVPIAHNSVDTVELTIFTVPLGGRFSVDYRVTVPGDHDSTNNFASRSFIAPELGVADSIPFFTVKHGDWQFGAPASPDEPQPVDGSNYWATVLGGNYAPNADWTIYTTDWMDVDGPDPIVVFDQWYQFGAGDGGWIEIDNGATVVKVSPVGGYNGIVNGDSGFVGVSDGWQQVIVDLSNLLVPGDSFRLLLHFFSDGSDEGLGWYVDNIELLDNYQRLPNDVAVREVWAPTAAQPLYRGQLVNLWAIVRLTSNTPSSRTFRVLAKIFDNDGVLVYSSSALVRNVNPGDIDTVYFSPGWIPFEVGTYRFIVTVYNLGDPNMLNNTMATNIVVQSDKGAQGDERQPIPRVFALSSLYPNPFSKNAAITFAVPHDAHVNISVFDAQGRFVRTLANGTFQPGYHTVTWDGTDNSGRHLNSGIYFVHMKADGFNAIKRIVLIR